MTWHEQKIVAITGSTGGYGLATAQKFKDNGYAVIIVSRNAEKVKNTANEYGFDDEYTLNVTDYNGWLSFKDYIEKIRQA